MKILRIGTKESKEKIEKILNRKTLLEDKRLEQKVKEIIEDVRRNGDQALLKYTRKFDRVLLTSKRLRVSRREIEEAKRLIDKDFIKALKKAYQNIKKYHEKQLPRSFKIYPRKGVNLEERFQPLERVGLYIPGGRASYPSTVLMAGVPAKIAGVREIIMVSPPQRDGKLSPYILVAAGLVGISEIYKAGGAQAIAALAYGTEIIPKVDKIVGPGNIYVTLAKKLVYGEVDIDMLAGPSEILILADESANPSFIACDLIAQAEHDRLSWPILVTTSLKLAQKVEEEIKEQVKSLRRKEIIDTSLKNNGVLIVTKNLKETIDLANEIAPEHLEIMTRNPEQVAKKIKNAGAIFLGPYSAESVGDYIAGPNHILPTSGTARFYSPLGVRDFMKSSHIISYSKEALKKEAKEIIELAHREGLDGHARAVKIRLQPQRTPNYRKKRKKPLRTSRTFSGLSGCKEGD
ncbi:histidinol dehydrogenase [bacterium]|nr:histidinol dehydrogenase [bacterium]MCG2677367.1 histidinol dehydrogenase [bacterium]